jgi:beta-galactosidase
MSKAIEQAAQFGLRTILCTPNAEAPPWLRQKDPYILGGNEHGPFDYGGRKGWCLNCRTYTDACDRIADAMGRHFGGNSNIIGWQLDNEPGFPFMCYDRNCLAGFQRWLQARYGSLDRLNEAWGNSFWSMIYNRWEQVEFALNRADGIMNPAQKLDYRRFFSDTFSRFLRRQAEILRPHIGGAPIWTNWPNPSWSVNVFESADYLDATSWDNYAPLPGITDPREQFVASRHNDLSRCAGPNQQFFISEQMPNIPAHAPLESIRLQTYANLAHGANGTIYFEWRPPLGGAEQGHPSVLQMDGSFNPAEPVLRRICRELASVGPPFADATTESDVAMIYCFDNQWHQGFWSGTDDYEAEFERTYKGAKKIARNIDIIPLARDLGRYRIVFAPGLQIISDENAARLRSYVEKGGILMLNTRAGTRDPDNRLREELPPGPFAEMCGLRVNAFSGKLAMANNRVLDATDQPVELTFGIRFNGHDKVFTVATAMEEIELRGAEVLATFQGDRMTGRPAITVNRFGHGHVVYVAANSFDIGLYEQLADILRERFAIEPLLPVPFGVEVVSRQAGNVTYLFVLNLTDKPRSITLPSPMKEVIGDTVMEGKMTLAPLDTWILVRQSA